MDMDARSTYGHLGESAERLKTVSVFRYITDARILVCARIGTYVMGLCHLRASALHLFV